MGARVRLFLDSGAFSAFRAKATIPIDDYIEFIKANLPDIDTYANLDVIPGRPNRPYPNTLEEVEVSARKSYDNLQRMKSKGLSPVPVFHQGEMWHWLEKLLEDREPYIGISTDKRLDAEDQRPWLDEVFTRLTDINGDPIVKTHGFGITNTEHLSRYPLTTVDSTTWAKAAGYGKILVPLPNRQGDGYDYSQPPLTVIASGQPQAWRTQQAKQLGKLDPIRHAHVVSYLAEIGLTITQVRYDDHARRLEFLHYFTQLQQHKRGVRFTHQRDDPSGKYDRPVVFEGGGRLRIIFATTTTSRDFSSLLTEVGANSRLLSYWELRRRPADFLAHYVKTGLIPGSRIRPVRAPSWDSDAYLRDRALALEARTRDYRDYEKNGEGS